VSNLGLRLSYNRVMAHGKRFVFKAAVDCDADPDVRKWLEAERSAQQEDLGAE